MIQLQALNYILKNNDIAFLTSYDKRYFSKYDKEYDFIKNHYIKNHKLPDMVTVVDKCPDFKVIDVSESRDYIQQRLFEEYVYEET